MVREAHRAGLQFDDVKLQALKCGDPEILQPSLPSKSNPEKSAPIPTIAIDPASPSPAVGNDRDLSPFGQPANGEDMAQEKRSHSRSRTRSPDPGHHHFREYVLPLILL